MNPDELSTAAKAGARLLAHLPTGTKNRVLSALADLIPARKAWLLAENEKDVRKAEDEQMPPALIDRLRITDGVIKEMVASLHDVIQLQDPVGEIVKLWTRPNGLRVGRMRIPIGVICIIYESRPNVTVEAFSLSFKSGNSVILKGGSEAAHSNQALIMLVREALESQGVSTDVVQFVDTGDRAYLYDLLKRTEMIDLVIPRGGEALIRSIVEHSRVPVLKHYKGVCAIYVDEHADLEMAVEVCLNAKVQKPATCNALETLLVHQGVAARFLPRMADVLREKGVALRGCEKATRLVPGMEPAAESDWYEEYLDLMLSVKVVSSIDEAIDHIQTYGSEHTDAIITRDYDNAWHFLRSVNSSLVLVNASTRLNDGFQLGLGAEMGISTTRLHAFGPMGLEELTVTKFIAFGEGQLRT